MWLTYVALWLAVGIVVKELIGAYVYNYAEKSGIGNDDRVTKANIFGEYLDDNYPKIFEFLEKLLNISPVLLRAVILICAIVFWPIYTPWYAITYMKACDNFVKNQKNEP